jgi:ribosome maturation factor RimP
MSWHQAVEQAAQSLGLELIAIERSGGLLRVTIDWPWVADAPERFVAAEDCERLTRQLQFVLEVENVDYARLEVSSPGIDRPMRHEQDLLRFEGEVLDVTFKAPVGEVGQAALGVAVGATRRKFRGRSLRLEDGAWQLACEEPPIGTPAPKGKQKIKVQHYALNFKWNEVKEAALAPLVNFKGRHAAPAAGSN